MKFYAFVLVVSVFVGTARGQLHVSVANEISGGYAIPDPDDKLELASLLRNPTVVNAIGVRGPQLEAIEKTLAENQGSFGFTFQTGGELPSKEELETRQQLKYSKSVAVLDELLSPDQWKMLRQAAFQSEIARIGLASAFANGRLGAVIGVTENQKAHLLEKGNQIQAKVELKIIELLREAQRELVAELGTEQRLRATEELGNPFIFRDALFRIPVEIRPKAAASNDTK